MRKVIFGGANSLDNFIARKDAGVDWLMWCDEAAAVTAKFWKSVDTVIMGRNTYEVALKSQMTSYPGMKTYICSKTLKDNSNKDISFVEDAVGLVKDLKAQEGKDICIMGGGLLAKPLFEAKLIDEIGFNIHPVLLGSGVPLFYEMNIQINLELIECQVFKNGCVLVSYKVKN